MTQKLSVLAVVLLMAAGSGCGESESDGLPAVLKTRFQTEMRTILHDLRLAQEQAAALEGGYLALDALRDRYFNRPVPESYLLTLSDVTPTGFRAEIEHKASKLSCRLVVGGEGPAAEGVPVCD
jgi:hypothetical protein